MSNANTLIPEPPVMPEIRRILRPRHDDDAIYRWLHSPNAILGGALPASLIAAGEWNAVIDAARRA